MVNRIIHIRNNYVKKKSSGLFKNIISKMCLKIIYLIYIYIYIYISQDYLVLNDLQWLICHKDKTNRTKVIPLGKM